MGTNSPEVLKALGSGREGGKGAENPEKVRADRKSDLVSVGTELTPF